MRRFAMVHNIPSPYRLHLFRVLGRRLAQRGYALRVHFMARTHVDRPHWAPAAGELDFEHVFHHDVGPRQGDKEWHLNPGLVASLWREAPEVLMVGGPWDTLTAAALTGLSRARRRIAWIEGNTHTPGRVTGLARALKEAMLARYDVIATPGQGGAAYTKLLLGDRAIPLVDLPNLVDETRFTHAGDPSEREALRAELGVPQGERLAIWNARLVPAKGVPEFLSKLAPEHLAGWRLAIFGEGPQQREVREAIASRGLGARVSLWDYWPYARMPGLYRAADLMLLPSMEDPNPLSVVEALHSGLPLLVSHRIGNHAEAILEGENGWTVDPTDEASVLRGVRAAFGASPETLRSMGEVSRSQAQRSWRSEASIDAFLDAAGVY